LALNFLPHAGHATLIAIGRPLFSRSQTTETEDQRKDYASDGDEDRLEATALETNFDASAARPGLTVPIRMVVTP
jgi:hypothetical protein